VVRILERLELESVSDNQAAEAHIESILSFQRSSVEKCTSMPHCSFCRWSSERMVVLALVGDKLVAKFEETLKTCSHQQRRQPSLPSGRQSARLEPHAFDAKNSAGLATAARASSTGRRLFLGDYEIHQSEWVSLFDTLLNLQFRRLDGLIAHFKTWAATTYRSAQLVMVSKLERRFRAITTVYRRRLQVDGGPQSRNPGWTGP
jgi:hypothetical protein